MTTVTNNTLLPFGENSLFRNDDSSSGPIDLSSIFESGIVIGDTRYTNIYVNTNGNVTFGGGLSTYTPEPIGTDTGSLDIIAPYWADVDTRGTTVETKNVFWDFNTERDSFVVTWNEVGYFLRNQDKENTFQLELVDTGSGNVEIIFRYTDIEWSAGDASGGSNGLGGVAARAGFAFGQELSFELPASGNQNAVLGLENNPGNNGVDGVWVFDIRDGALINVGGSGNDTLAGDESGNSIFGNDGNDNINAANGNDFIYGGNGEDQLFGGVGNDFISGGLGNDFLDGGDGFDIADCLSYEFDPNSFSVNTDGSVSLQAEGFTDTLVNIESVAFSNGELRFDSGYFDNFGAAYRFYTSILGRSPDGAGLDFYVSLLDAGVSIFDIAQDISTSPEFIQNFGDGLSTEAFLGRVYENILGRTPDLAGLDFWRNAIDTQEVNRSEAIVYISEDVENQNNTANVIGNGFFVEDFGF